MTPGSTPLLIGDTQAELGRVCYQCYT